MPYFGVLVSCPSSSIYLFHFSILFIMGQLPILGTIHTVLTAGARAAEAAITGQRLNKDLRTGRTEVLQLLERGLLAAAEERYQALKQRADTFCTHKELDRHELPTFLPALLELEEMYTAVLVPFRQRQQSSQKRAEATHSRSNLAESVPQKEVAAPVTIKSSSPVSKPEVSPAGISLLRPSIRIIVPTSGKTLYITWLDAPKHGTLQLAADEPGFDDDYYPTGKRQLCLQQSVVFFESFLCSFCNHQRIPGKIFVREFLESQIPARYYVRFNKELSWEQMITPFIKRVRQNGPALLWHGERILRFHDYEAFPDLGAADLIVEHENEEEIESWLTATQGGKDITTGETLSAITMVPTSTGALCTPYKSKPAFGYISLRQVRTNNFTKQKQAFTTLLRAEITQLEHIAKIFQQKNSSLELPGRITLLEYQEDQIPAEVKQQFINANRPYEEQLKAHLKVDKRTGETLTRNGQRIVQFRKYDAINESSDVLVAHENADAVRFGERAQARCCTIVPNKTTGNLFTVYSSQPEFGFIVLKTEGIVAEKGWLRRSIATVVLRERITTLQAFLATHAHGGQLPGRIQCLEYLESQVPTHIALSFWQASVASPEQLESYTKDGKSGVMCTVNGERVLRFTRYDASGTTTDIHIWHDEVETTQPSVEDSVTPAASPSISKAKPTFMLAQVTLKSA
jgi:hypothetical protein